MLNPLSDLSIPIGKEVVWILFFLTTVFVVGMSFVFNYHWKYYGLHGKNSLVVKILYVVGTIALLSFTLLLATMF